MAITQFIFTLFCTVGFCLGLRIVTDKGQLFYFLRKPFDKLKDTIEINSQRSASLLQFNPMNAEIKKLKRNNKIFDVVLYAMKPVLLCVTCLASVWGVTWFIILNDVSIELIKFMVLNSFIAAFTNTFIWNLYERL